MPVYARPAFIKGNVVINVMAESSIPFSEGNNRPRGFDVPKQLMRGILFGGSFPVSRLTAFA